jgi:hypothetical protein
VKDKPTVVIHSNGDAFADPTYFANDMAFQARDWRLDGSQEKRAQQSNTLKPLAHEARLECGDVGSDVREFRRAYQLAS